MKTSRKQESVLHYLVHHPLSEVGHVGLREGQPRPPRDVLRELAGEHPAVRAVHLLRNLLGDDLAPAVCEERGALLVLMFLLEVGGETRQTVLE